MAYKIPAILLIILVLHPKTPEGQWRIPVVQPPPSSNPPPVCSLQFAVVNNACSRLPYRSVPPPSPPAPPSPPSRDHRNGHRHRHHVHKETPVEEECCRWLKEVDNVCACELFAALPKFLTWPVHNYTVVVDQTCDVTFQCSST